MAIKSKAKGAGSVSFNMVPMIDIVFQLLIFLMVTRHFYEMSTVEVQLPPAIKAESKMQELMQYSQVVINIVSPRLTGDKTTQIIIDGIPLVKSVEGGAVPDWDPLIAYLKKKQATIASTPFGTGKPMNVILRADDNVPYETIGSVMISVAMANIKYWWVQAYTPRTPSQDDQEKRKFLGVETAMGGN